MKTSSIFSAFLALATLVVSQSSLESSQIEAINSEINQSYSQASSAFNSKVGAIKSKISRQQLNQGFATIDLNLPATYKKMFDDIAASEKLVHEYQQLSEVVGKMAVEANKLVKTPAPDSAFAKDMEVMRSAAQKAQVLSKKFSDLVYQRIQVTEKSLANVDLAIAKSTEAARLNKETADINKKIKEATNKNSKN